MFVSCLPKSESELHELKNSMGLTAISQMPKKCTYSSCLINLLNK